MDRLEELRDRFASLGEELKSFARESLEANQDEVMNLQRIQLFRGKRSDGNDIRPYYSEDLESSGGYFKSPQQARLYAIQKANRSYPVNVPRVMDAPNLYINGKFHSELGVFFGDEEFEISGTTPFADKIVDKYGLDTFGLSDESLETLKPNLEEIITNKIRDYLNG